MTDAKNGIYSVGGSDYLTVEEPVCDGFHQDGAVYYAAAAFKNGDPDRKLYVLYWLVEGWNSERPNIDWEHPARAEEL